MASAVDQLIDRRVLLQMGARALQIIKERTLAGQFLPGSTGGSEYSTTPLPLPFSRLQKAVQRGSIVKQLVRSGEAHVFTNIASRNTWIVLKGGYKQLRELAGKSTNNVTLTWRGTMLRNLKITETDVATLSVTLGFTDSDSERIASYHDQLGAGKRKVTHKFMGLTEQEHSVLAQYISLIITQR